jgi:hypothetical protein
MIISHPGKRVTRVFPRRPALVFVHRLVCALDSVPAVGARLPADQEHFRVRHTRWNGDANRVVLPPNTIPGLSDEILSGRCETITGHFGDVRDRVTRHDQNCRLVFDDDGKADHRLSNITFTYEASPRPDQRTAYEQGNRVSESRRLTDITILTNGALVRRYHLNYTILSPASSRSLVAILVASVPFTFAVELRLTYDQNGNLVTGDGKFRTYNSLIS